MRRYVGKLLLGLSAGVLAIPALSPIPATAEVSVNVNIGPPAIVVHEPPEMVVVPQTMVYYAPGVSVDLFFHNGFWWTINADGYWFRARTYNGPWTHIRNRRVPREVIVIRDRDYRKSYAHGHRVPHGQLKKHWRAREIERRERRGDWREHRKEVRKERKRDEKEYRKEMKEHGRDDRGHGRGRD